MSEQLVTVESYQFLPEAEAVRMHLEAEGITAVLVDAETVSTEWSLGNAIGYIKLRVPQSQVDAAQLVLNELRAKRRERSESPENDAVARCLSCDAQFKPNQSKCEQCGWSYADGDQEFDEPSDTEPDLNESVMEKLRAAKRPMILMLLWPLLVVFGGLVLLILGWVSGLAPGSSFN